MYIDSSFLVDAQWEELAQNLIPVIKITTVVLQHVLNVPQSCNKYDTRWVINGRSSSQMTWGTNQGQCWSGENRDMAVSPSTRCRLYTNIYSVFFPCTIQFYWLHLGFSCVGILNSISWHCSSHITSVCLVYIFTNSYWRANKKRNGKLSMN